MNQRISMAPDTVERDLARLVLTVVELLRQLMERQALRLQASVDAVALAAALAQPWADVVLSGAATVEQLRANIWAPQVAWDAEAAEALAAIAEPPASYWEQRRHLPWN